MDFNGFYRIGFSFIMKTMEKSYRAIDRQGVDLTHTLWLHVALCDTHVDRLSPTCTHEP